MTRERDARENAKGYFVSLPPPFAICIFLTRISCIPSLHRKRGKRGDGDKNIVLENGKERKGKGRGENRGKGRGRKRGWERKGRKWY